MAQGLYRRRNLIILILILGGAFYLRVTGIRWGLPTKNLALTTYHPDEAAMLYTFEEIKQNKTIFLPLKVFFDWGPFYFYMVGAALGISYLFGIISIASREFLISHLAEADKLYIIARLVTVFAGVLNVYLIYLIGKKLFNKNTGLLAALLMAILPAHVIGSHYAKADVPVCLWITLTLYFSVMILTKGDLKFYIFSGLFLAIAVATKPNGGVAIFAILTAHIFRIIRNSSKNFFCNLFSKNIFLTFVVFLISFSLVNPFYFLFFNKFTEWFLGIFHAIAGTPCLWDVGWGTPSWQRYITSILNYGLGPTLLVFFFIGILVSFYKSIITKNNADGFLLVTAILTYILISKPKLQLVMYALPITPFVALLTSRTLVYNCENQTKIKKLIFIFLTLILLANTFIYTFAYINLLKQKDVREDASEWISRNIPKTAVVGISKSYYWTPPIIRQYNPPYKVLVGGGIQSHTDESIRGLKKVIPDADYIVLSDFEYREFLRLPNYCPEENKILTEIMNEKYQEIAKFEKSPSAFGITFKKKWPPWDWMYPNPTIIVLKRK